MGRSASGVRGIRLREDDYVVGMDVMKPDSEVLVITENGYGKRTKASEYPIKGRGGKGIKTANITAKNGNLAGLTTVNGEEDIMLITNTGVIIRFDVDTVSQTGRATLGVRLIRVGEDAIVSTMAKVDAEPIEEEVETETTPIVFEASNELDDSNTAEEIENDTDLDQE